MELARYEFGTPSALPTLLIVHGLFGAARNWQGIAKRLGADRRVVCVDLRNHGHSFWHDDHSYAALADDLLAVIGDLGGTVDLLGHSMGGKAAMMAALRAQDKINRLIVVDIAPTAYGHDQMQNVNAMQALPLGAITSRRGADEILQNHIADSATRAFLLQSLDFSDVRPRWRLNLMALGQNMDQILGFPAVSGLQYQHPCLIVSGNKSDYILAQHHDLILSHFPQAQFAALPTGHWVQAEAPNEFIQTVQQFLTKTDP